MASTRVAASRPRLLPPTQADLELISAGAARNATDLKHALASNKKLLKWKVVTAPRIEALKTKVRRGNRRSVRTGADIQQKMQM